ncbi:MAG: hypothetical protein NDF54_07980 [archaeon GB-1867-035]|nr:hypothetical protein [Candidatus Culexmicrobium profundum]
MLRGSEEQLPPDILIEIVSSIDLADITYAKKVIKKVITSRNTRLVRMLFDKLSPPFIFSSKCFKVDILDYLSSIILNNLSFDDVVDLGKESILGSLLALDIIIRRVKIIDCDRGKLNLLEKMSSLKFMRDPNILLIYPFEDKLILNLDERINALNETLLRNIIKICEILFAYNLIEKSRGSCESFILLYEALRKTPDYNVRYYIVKSLIDRKATEFIAYIKKFNILINSIDNIPKYYDIIFKTLISFGIPVYFEVKNVKINDRLYNDNFFFLKFRDRRGNERILWPFEQIETSHVQSIYDPVFGVFITPREYFGKIKMEEIFSFRKVRQIRSVTEEEMLRVSLMDENTIERLIREILSESEATPHGPTELADILSLNILINNEHDLRNAAFIIKGRSYKRVKLKDIAVNLIKAVNIASINIIFLVYVGVIDDQALKHFIELCEKNRKMYCIINCQSLTKLFKAYNKL